MFIETGALTLGTVITRTPLPVPPITLVAWQVGLGCVPMVVAGLNPTATARVERLAFRPRDALTFTQYASILSALKAISPFRR